MLLYLLLEIKDKFHSGTLAIEKLVTCFGELRILWKLLGNIKINEKYYLLKQVI